MRDSDKWLEKVKKRKETIEKIKHVLSGSVIAALIAGPFVYFAVCAEPLDLPYGEQFQGDVGAAPEVKVSQTKIPVKEPKEKKEPKENIGIEIAAEKKPDKLKNKELVEGVVVEDEEVEIKNAIATAFLEEPRDVKIKNLKKQAEGTIEELLILDEVGIDFGPSELKEKKDADPTARNTARKYIESIGEKDLFDVYDAVDKIKNSKKEGQLVLSDLKQRDEKWYATFQQYNNQNPVFDGSLKLIFSEKKTLIAITDNLKRELPDISEITVGQALAEETAKELFEWDDETDMIEFVNKGYYKKKPAYKVEAGVDNPVGDWEIYIDGRNGEVEAYESNLRFQDAPEDLPEIPVINEQPATPEPESLIPEIAVPEISATPDAETLLEQPATDEPGIVILEELINQIAGLIFPTNPNDEQVLRPFPNQYVFLESTEQVITESDGSFPNSDDEWYSVFLDGPYVTIHDNDATANVEIIDETPDTPFVWTEDHASLAAINAFYHANKIHDYFRDNHDFEIDKNIPITVNSHLVDAYLNGCGAWFDNNLKTIEMGRAGTENCPDEINYALSSDVVFHEYTHFITEDITHFPNIPGTESLAMSEAISDYFAATINNDSVYAGIVAPSRARNLDNTLNYNTDATGESYYDSQIFSGALWDLRQAIGQEEADRLVFNTLYQDRLHFETFMYGMIIEDDDDEDFSNGTPNLIEIIRAFENHGIGPGVENFDGLPIDPEEWTKLLEETPPEGEEGDQYGGWSGACSWNGTSLYVSGGTCTLTGGGTNPTYIYIYSSGILQVGSGATTGALNSSGNVYNYGKIYIGGTSNNSSWVHSSGSIYNRGTGETTGTGLIQTASGTGSYIFASNATLYVGLAGSTSTYAGGFNHYSTGTCTFNSVYIYGPGGVSYTSQVRVSSGTFRTNYLYVYDYETSTSVRAYIYAYGSGTVDVNSQMYLGNSSSSIYQATAYIYSGATLNIDSQAYIYDYGDLYLQSGADVTGNGTINVFEYGNVEGQLRNYGDVDVGTINVGSTSTLGGNVLTYSGATTDSNYLNIYGDGDYTVNSGGTAVVNTYTQVFEYSGQDGRLTNSGDFDTPYINIGSTTVDGGQVTNYATTFDLNNTSTSLRIYRDGLFTNNGTVTTDGNTYIYENSGVNGSLVNNSGDTFNTDYIYLGDNTYNGGSITNDGTIDAFGINVYGSSQIDNTGTIALDYSIVHNSAKNNMVINNGNSAGTNAGTITASGITLQATQDTGTITEFASGGTGEVRATSNGHGLLEGQELTIYNTTNYNGTYTIKDVTTNTFDFVDTYVATETGNFNYAKSIFNNYPNSSITLTGNLAVSNYNIVENYGEIDANSLNLNGLATRFNNNTGGDLATTTTSGDGVYCYSCQINNAADAVNFEAADRLNIFGTSSNRAKFNNYLKDQGSGYKTTLGGLYIGAYADFKNEGTGTGNNIARLNITDDALANNSTSTFTDSGYSDFDFDADVTLDGPTITIQSTSTIDVDGDLDIGGGSLTLNQGLDVGGLVYLHDTGAFTLEGSSTYTFGALEIRDARSLWVPSGTDIVLDSGAKTSNGTSAFVIDATSGTSTLSLDGALVVNGNGDVIFGSNSYVEILGNVLDINSTAGSTDIYGDTYFEGGGINATNDINIPEGGYIGFGDADEELISGGAINFYEGSSITFTSNNIIQSSNGGLIDITLNPNGSGLNMDLDGATATIGDAGTVTLGVNDSFAADTGLLLQGTLSSGNYSTSIIDVGGTDTLTVDGGTLNANGPFGAEVPRLHVLNGGAAYFTYDGGSEYTYPFSSIEVQADDVSETSIVDFEINSKYSTSGTHSCAVGSCSVEVGTDSDAGTATFTYRESLGLYGSNVYDINDNGSYTIVGTEDIGMIGSSAIQNTGTLTIPDDFYIYETSGVANYGTVTMDAMYLGNSGTTTAGGNVYNEGTWTMNNTGNIEIYAGKFQNAGTATVDLGTRDLILSGVSGDVGEFENNSTVYTAGTAYAFRTDDVIINSYGEFDQNAGGIEITSDLFVYNTDAVAGHEGVFDMASGTTMEINYYKLGDTSTWGGIVNMAGTSIPAFSYSRVYMYYEADFTMTGNMTMGSGTGSFIQFGDYGYDRAPNATFTMDSGAGDLTVGYLYIYGDGGLGSNEQSFTVDSGGLDISGNLYLYEEAAMYINGTDASGGASDYGVDLTGYLYLGQAGAYNGGMLEIADDGDINFANRTYIVNGYLHIADTTTSTSVNPAITFNTTYAMQLTRDTALADSDSYPDGQIFMEGGYVDATLSDLYVGYSSDSNAVFVMNDAYWNASGQEIRVLSDGSADSYITLGSGAVLNASTINLGRSTNYGGFLRVLSGACVANGHDCSSSPVSSGSSTAIYLYNGGYLENNGIIDQYNGSSYLYFNDLGDTGSITTFLNGGTGVTRALASNHGLFEGATVTITDTTNYDGVYTIFNVTSSTFDFSATYVAGETGTWSAPTANYIDNNSGAEWYGGNLYVWREDHKIDNNGTLNFKTDIYFGDPSYGGGGTITNYGTIAAGDDMNFYTTRSVENYGTVTTGDNLEIRRDAEFVNKQYPIAPTVTVTGALIVGESGQTGGSYTQEEGLAGQSATTKTSTTTDSISIVGNGVFTNSDKISTGNQLTTANSGVFQNVYEGTINPSVNVTYHVNVAAGTTMDIPENTSLTANYYFWVYGTLNVDGTLIMTRADANHFEVNGGLVDTSTTSSVTFPGETPSIELINGGKMDLAGTTNINDIELWDNSYFCVGDNDGSWTSGSCDSATGTATVNNMEFHGNGTTMEIARNMTVSDNFDMATYVNGANTVNHTNGTLTVDSSTSFKIDGGTLNSSAPISVFETGEGNSGELQVSGGSTLNLTGASYDFGNIHIYDDDTLTFGSPTSETAVTITDYAPCIYGGGNCAIELGGSTTAGPQTLTLYGDLTINDLTSTDPMVKIGGSSGINGGVLNIKATSDVGSSIINNSAGNLDIDAGGTLNIEYFDATNYGVLDFDGDPGTTGDGGNCYVDGTATIDGIMRCDSLLWIEDDSDVTTGLESVISVTGSTTTVDSFMTLDGTMEPGDLTVTSTGWISSGVGDSTNFFIDADSIDVEAGGKISSDGVSTRNNGAAASSSEGGAFAGEGVGNANTPDAEIKAGGSQADYTSAGGYNPNYGDSGDWSGGESNAGGAVYIRSTGDITINGDVTADGADNNTASQATGSGGTVIIEQDIAPTDTTSVFNGSGTISANGGNSTQSTTAVGSGGAIIIDSRLLDDPDDTGSEYDFAGTITAYGGDNSGGGDDAPSGTIVYLGDDNNPDGTLIVDQNNNTAGTGLETWISDATWTFQRVEGRNGAQVDSSSARTNNASYGFGCYETGTGSQVQFNNTDSACDNYNNAADKAYTLYVNDTLTGAQSGSEPSVASPQTPDDTSPAFSIVVRNLDETSEKYDEMDIQVTTDPTFASITEWNGTVSLESGWENGERTEDVEYGGASPLTPGTTYYVRARLVNGDGEDGLWTHKDIDNHYKFSPDTSAYFEITDGCSGSFSITDISGGGNIKDKAGDRIGEGTCTMTMNSAVSDWQVQFGRDTTFNDGGSNNIDDIDNAGSDCVITEAEGSEEEYGFYLANVDLDLWNPPTIQYVTTNSDCSQTYNASGYYFTVPSSSTPVTILDGDAARTGDETFDIGLRVKVEYGTVATSYSLGLTFTITSGP